MRETILSEAQASKNWGEEATRTLKGIVGFAVAKGIAKQCDYASGAFDKGAVTINLPWGMAGDVAWALEDILPKSTSQATFQVRQFGHHTISVCALLPRS